MSWKGGRTSAGGVAQSGTVKSWNGARGYGFITCPSVNGDIMFMRTDLPEDCREVRGKFLDGKQVVVQVSTNGGKNKAASVQVIAQENEQLAGKIKSFSEKHGYGFIQSSMVEGDVRFELRDIGDLPGGCDLKNELVVFSMKLAPDGKLRGNNVMFQSQKIASRLKGGQAGHIGSMNLSGGGAGADSGTQAQIRQLEQMLAQLKGSISGQSGGGMGRQGGGGKQQNAASLAMLGARPVKRQRTGTTGTGQFLSGTVKSYNGKKGFGFISTIGIPGDVFFMKTELTPDLQQMERQLQGVEVTFTAAVNDEDGRLRATQISAS